MAVRWLLVVVALIAVQLDAGFLKKVACSIKSAAQDAGKAIESAGNKAGKGIASAAEQTGDFCKDAATATGKACKTAEEAIAQGTVVAAEEAGKFCEKAAKETAKAVAGAASTAAETTRDFAGDAAEDTAEAFTRMAKLVEQHSKRAAGEVLLAVVEHEYCAAMMDPAADTLENILYQIAAHMRPDRVYTVVLGNNSSLPIAEVWRQSNARVRELFGSRVYCHSVGKSWPTVRDLKGKIIVFLDEDLPDEAVLPVSERVIHPLRPWIFETRFSYTSGCADLRNPASCTCPDQLIYPSPDNPTATTKRSSPDGQCCGIDRGEVTYQQALEQLERGSDHVDKLFMVHHYMTQRFAGDKRIAAAINQKQMIVDRLIACQQQTRCTSNLVQVDFVNQQAREAISEYNQHILVEHQQRDPTLRDVNDLRYNQIAHLMAHNASSCKPQALNTRLGFDLLAKIPGIQRDLLAKIEVHNQELSIPEQIRNCDVTGFKLPLRSDPRPGCAASSRERILWVCHSLEKSDLKTKIKDTFGV